MTVSDIRLPIGYTEKDLIKAASKKCGLAFHKIRNIKIIKRSIDARKKPAVYYQLTVAVNEGIELSREKSLALREVKPLRKTKQPVIVIGAGPSGLFAALTLLENGIPAVILERGKDVYSRKKDVEHFWATGELDPESNVQFGEGGAGTFSDGKLFTSTKDKNGLNDRVLRIFYEAGAEDNILYDTHAHIGTDKLLGIVASIRERIKALGGEIVYSTCMQDLLLEDGKVIGVKALGPDGLRTFTASEVIFAAGHSAKDAYEMLKRHKVPMEQKAFAIGVRIIHPQPMITLNQYGTLEYKELGAAPYKLTTKLSSGRGVYSFCMCPGGYVVNASSEAGYLAVNGMSDAARDSGFANSGIVVQVSPSDYPSDNVLAGLELQRAIEKKAFDACGGKIPVQAYIDFKNNRLTEKTDLTDGIKGAVGFAKISEILPEFISEALEEALPRFGKMIDGFDREDALLLAAETRTSSPVRIVRNEHGESMIRGFYPCGEGGGYAGGIVSSAMDGIRTAEHIIGKESQ